MKTLIGVVKSNIEPKRGEEAVNFKAEFGDGIGKIDVIYTSPMYRVDGGGLLAIPENGDRILAAYNEVTGEAYYHSTIVDKRLTGEIKQVPGFKAVPTPDVFSKEGKPVKVQYTNQVGAGLEITRHYRAAPDPIITSVDLKSEGGKKITLNDSPGIEAVIVRNQHGDGLTVKGDPDDLKPGRSIELTSHGPQCFTVMESSMDLTVVEGRDIIIENRSTGAMAQEPGSDQWPNERQPCRRWGGIYLKSENGDVSLSTNADDGRIFIITPKARIQITDDGEVQIDSSDSIQIRSDGDINMEGNNVNIKANSAFSVISTGDASILSSGNSHIDGSEVHLNSGSPASDPTIRETPLNDYEIPGEQYR